MNDPPPSSSFFADIALPEDQLCLRRIKVALVESEPAIAAEHRHIANL